MKKYEAPMTALFPRSTPILVGHEEQVKRCLDLIRGERFPHALLLQGPQGIGKATFAYHLIRTLFSWEGANCGPLKDSFISDPESALFKRVCSLGHGDLKVIERVSDDQGKCARDITVDQIRQITTFFSKAPFEGGWRIALIDSVDEMNGQASNALLKILEEPPRKSLLLLINHCPGTLLPTLASRCYKLLFRDLSEAQGEEVLKAQRPDLDGEVFSKGTSFLPAAPGKQLPFYRPEHEGLLEALQDLTTRLCRQRPFDPFPFLDGFFSMRGTSSADMFSLVATALLEWLYRVIEGGAREILSPELRTLYGEKSPFEWAELYADLTSLFQGENRLSYSPRHLLLSAFMRIADATSNPRKGSYVT